MLEFYESFVLHGSGSILDSVTVEDWLWWHRADSSSIPLECCTAGYQATVAVSDLKVELMLEWNRVDDSV